MLYDPSREFLPASALESGRCPESIRDALIAVLRKFESGEVQEVHRVSDDRYYRGYYRGRKSYLQWDRPTANRQCFNMSVWAHSYNGCGTVMCIGGWIEHVGVGRLPHDWKIRLPQLYALCHPFDDDDLSQRWNDLTLPQACRAIRHYLITSDGTHAWDGA